MIKIHSFTNIIKPLRIGLIAGALMMSPTFANVQSSAKNNNADTFELLTKDIPPSGTSDKAVLLEAPNPHVNIAGERKTAAIVVDISKNVLYHYDGDGKPLAAYLIASGKNQLLLIQV